MFSFVVVVDDDDDDVEKIYLYDGESKIVLVMW